MPMRAFKWLQMPLPGGIGKKYTRNEKSAQTIFLITIKPPEMPSFMSKLLELSLPLLPLRAELLNEIGVSAFNTGRKEIAEAFFARAVKRDPACAPALYNLGRAMRDQGRFERAIACFEKTLELGAMGIEPENDLGVIQL